MKNDKGIICRSYTGPKDVQLRAQAIINDVLRGIKQKWRYLIEAVNMLVPTAVEPMEWCYGCFGTDGKHLFYDPLWTVKAFYLYDQHYLKHNELEILHIIIHGLLGHFGRDRDAIDRELLWQVMDLQVSEIMGLRVYSKSVMSNTGLNLYYRALKDEKLKNEINDVWNVWTFTLIFDDHRLWNVKGPESEELSKEWKMIGEGLFGEKDGDDRTALSNRAEDCETLMRIIKEGLGKTQGSGSQGEKKICMAKETDNSYSALLQELRSIGEINREEDIIDPILYSYGLEQYGDVPLIEPMDIVESIKLNTIVIAVDTSGSCADVLDRFWGNTRRLLKDIAAFGSINAVELIECDDEIHNRKTIRDVTRIGLVSLSHSFSGLGGTDFRPVFELADHMAHSGEQIDCLIYFSDGEGSFPERMPEYPVYFVIPGTQEKAFAVQNDMIPKWVKVIYERVTM